jgi:pyridoxamine 5'-phosphate oxidase
VSIPTARRDYQGGPLLEADAGADPVDVFLSWFRGAAAAEADANAMALATVDGAGQPSVRIVLLKDVDERGLTFYTNYESRKGHDLMVNDRAAVVFFWRSIDRQVRVEGHVERVSPAESDAYFATRPIEARWSAVASPQSRPVDSREALEARVAEIRRAQGDGVTRPTWWGGYRLRPQAFEFWQGRPNRLHDRLRYERQDGGWCRVRLAP